LRIEKCPLKGSKGGVLTGICRSEEGREGFKKKFGLEIYHKEPDHEANLASSHWGLEGQQLMVVKGKSTRGGCRGANQKKHRYGGNDMKPP